MRLIMLSDTHTFHEQVNVPEGEVLIHAGDMGLRGTKDEIQNCLCWLNSQPHKHVVAIAGNHDWAIAKKAKLDFGRIVYLENSGVNIEGYNFYGSPVTPWFMDWAFNVHRGAKIKKYWDMIPEAGCVDVVISHGPPLGILDQSAPMFGSEHLGCEELAERIKDSVPLVHCFGHIHGGYGYRSGGQTQFFNCSQVNEAYKVVNKPWVIEI